MPETQLYCGLSRRPIFVPSVGHYRQGMLVSVPLHLDTLQGKPDRRRPARGAGGALSWLRPFVRVTAPPADGKLEPQALNETNLLELSVHANETHRQAVLVARLDNLGKGASGAAVQNLRLMLGLPVDAPRSRRSWMPEPLAGPGSDLHAGRRHPEGGAGRFHRAHRGGDRRRGDRLGDRHLVPLPGARRPQLHPHRRAHQHPGWRDHPCGFRRVRRGHRRRRHRRAQRGDPRLHAEEPGVRRHLRHRAGWRGDRGGRHARRRRSADAGQGDRSERALGRRAGEAAARDERRGAARNSTATRWCIANWPRASAPGCAAPA